MKTFLKIFFILIILAFLADIAWGYFSGSGLGDIKEYISDFISSLMPNSDTTAPDTSKTIAVLQKKVNTPPPSVAIDEVDTNLQPLPPNSFEEIDKYALSCPADAQRDVQSLAAYLQRNAHSDIEKARAIYIWITNNINYDDNGFNSGIYPDNSAQAVLNSRKAVCDGFSNLYLALGQAMGLTIAKVGGYSKGYGYYDGMKFKKADHAWNVIKISGRWRIFDATWGHGSADNVNGKLVSTKRCSNYWFNVDPYEAIFTHLPQNTNMEYILPGIDLKTFEAIPRIDPGYFELGYDGRKTLKKILANSSLMLPKCMDVGTYIKAISVPEEGLLFTDKVYDFEYYVPRGISVALIDANKEWVFFKCQKDTFRLEHYTPSEGELQVGVRLYNGLKSYSTFMIYTVKAAKAAS